MPKYNKRIVAKICKLVSTDSYTIAEICTNVGISESCYYNWQANIVEFGEAIKKAEDERLKFFAIEAKKSLLKKIQGYTVQEKKVVMVEGKPDDNGKTKPKIKEQIIIDKHFQPDTTAIIFTLTNQDPENWKNKYNSDVNVKVEQPLFADDPDHDSNKEA